MLFDIPKTLFWLRFPASRNSILALWKDHLLKDARHYQIAFLSAFLLYGIFVFGWDTELLKYGTIAVTCFSIQWAAAYFTNRDYSSLKSAWISTLSLCLMLHANSVITLALASALSIGSKFLIRYQGKHIFNPTNFGIITAMLITGDGWISPGQWGSNGHLVFLIGLAGFAVLTKVKRLDTAIAFLLTFLGLGFIRNILYLGWPMDFFLHQLSSGTLLLFTFFMITDPRSSPNNRTARIVWAALIGTAAFLMSYKLFVHAAPIWALFFLSPLTLLFDKIFKEKNFGWK